MNNAEKRKLIQSLLECEKREDCFYQALEAMGDLKTNYYDYTTTEPMNCDEEMKRLPDADYELCTVLLTMLLREDHFFNGSFMRRYEACFRELAVILTSICRYRAMWSVSC